MVACSPTKEGQIKVFHSTLNSTSVPIITPFLPPTKSNIVSTTTVTTAVNPGSTLSASSNQTWSSSSATFSLGFVAVQPPTTHPSSSPTIVYAGGAPVVWSAGNGAAVDSGGSLQFLQSGALRLVNGSGATAWDSGTANRGATSATLEDSGNLVISNGTGTLWSSFDHPTDTLLPSQNFTVGEALTSESYSFGLSSIGNLTLKWNNSVVYWTQGLNSSVNVSLDSPVLGLTAIGLLQLSDVNLSRPVDIAYSSDYAEGNSGDVLRVLKLDNDGNLRIYSTNKGSGSATVRWAAVEDQCEVYAYCGNYGVCGYNDSSQVCGCPSENFEMVDPNDARKGCRRKVSLNNCQGSATMLTLDHAVILSYPPEAASQSFFTGISACRGNCLSGSRACFASTALSDGTGQCVMKSEDFVSGYHNPSLPSTSFVKVCPPLAPNPPPSLGETVSQKRSRVPAWVVVVVLGTLLGLIALEGGLWMWCCRFSARLGGLSAQYALLEYASGAPVQFSGTGTYLSSNASALSTIGASPPGPSSSSSFQTSGVSTFTSGRNTEKATSSLLQSDT
ncbi:G-type lectin S-receptor serine/threonine-protein kinase [Spatholobus suberectus]|nr:G-type lectin S-receptor serine/threonine-protein kinase [Spatholobus suberectus]